MNMEYKFLLLPRRSAGERNPVPPPKLLQMEDMPMWKTLPYDTKYPLQKVAKEDEKPLSKEIGKSLYNEYPNKDFDLRVAENPILPSISYNSLHDPHLQHFFQSTLRYRNLVKRGFVSKDGKVRFHLAQFNQYRMYLYHLWVMQVNQLRRNQVCEEKKRVKSVLEAHDSKDILCEKVLNKYDRIDIEAVLEELSARILQEYGFSPLARSLFRWKCYQDKLRKNYKESYPVMKQWLSAQTKNYRLLLESKLNARRNKDRKLRIRLEKLRESSKARLNRVTYLRQLQEDSRRILKEERHKYFAKIWAKNNRKMHLKKRKPVTKVDKKSTISEDTLLNYWKAKGFGLGQDVDAQLQGFEIPFSSSVSESCEEIIKKSCDTSEGNTSLSHNTTNDESEKCFRKHPQVLDYSSVLNHRSEHVTPDECPSVKEVNRHPSDLVKGTISDFEAKDITVKKFQSHYLPSDKRPLKVLKKNNEDLRGTNKNNEDLRGTNRNNEDLRGTKKNNEDLRSKLLALSSSQSTTDTFEESLTEEEKNLLQTKASVSVRKRKLKSHERTSTDPTKSSSICNRLFSSVSKLQGKQMKKTESEKNKKKLDEEDDLLTTSRNDSKRYINRKFSFPECESSSSCATYGKQKPKQEAKLCNRRKEDTHSNSIISRCDIQAENHISKLDQAKETKEEPCYDSTKQKQIKTKYSIESFQSEHTKLRQNNTNKRHEMEYWTKEIDLDSDKASSVEALGLRTDMQKDIHLGKLNQLKQTKEEPCNKLRFQKQAERKSGTKSLQSERKKIRRNSSLNQRKQQEIQCWKETEKESDKASEEEVRRFHSDRQKEINLAELDQSEETKEQPYDQLKKQKWAKSKYSPELFQSEQKKAKRNGTVNQIKQQVADYRGKKAEMESDKILEASTSRLRTDIHEESGKTLEARLRTNMHEDISSSKLDQWKQAKDDKCDNLKNKKQAKAKSSFEYLHSEQKKEGYSGTLNQMKQPERDYYVKETETESDEVLKMEVSGTSNDNYPIINHFSPQEKQKFCKITWKMLENSLLERRKKYSDLNGLDELKLKLKKNELIQKEFSNILKDYPSTTEIISRSVSRAKKGSKSETGNFIEKLGAFRSLTWKKPQTEEKQVLKKKDFSIERSFSNVRKNKEHHDVKITDEDYARIPSTNGGIIKTVERAGIKAYTGTKFTKTLAEDFVHRNNEAEIKKKVLKRFKDNFFIEMYMAQKHRLQRDLHDYFFTDSISRSQVKRYYESGTKDREESVLHIDHYEIKEGKKIINQKQHKFEFDERDSIHSESEHKIAPHKKRSNIISGITKAEIQKPIEKFELSKESEQIIKKKDAISRSCLEEEKLPSDTKVLELGKEDNGLLSTSILNEDYHVDLINPEIREESISANEFYPTDNELLSKTTESEIPMSIEKSELSKGTEQIIKKEDVASRSCLEEENISSDAKVSELKKEEDNGLLSTSILNEDYHVDITSPEVREESISAYELYPTDNELLSKTTESEIPMSIEKSELSKGTEQIIKKEDVASRSCLEEENISSDAKVSEFKKEEDNGLLSTSILNEDYHVDITSPEVREESISAYELYPTDNELLSKTTKSEIPMSIEKSELSKGTEQIIKKEDVASRSCLEDENISSDAKVSELKKEEDNGLLSTSILNQDYHVDITSPEVREESISAYELYPTDNEMSSEIIEAGIQKPNEKTELSQVIPQTSEKGGISKSRLEQAKVLSYSETRKCEKDEEGHTLFSNANYHADLISSEMSEECISAHEIYPTDNGSFSENLQKTEEDFTTLLKTCAADEQTTEFSADDTKYSSAPLKDETIFHFSNVQLSKDKHSEIPGSNVFISPYILHKNKVLSISSKEYPYSDENMYSDEGYGKRLERKMPSENALETETVSTVFELPLFPETEHWNYDSRIEDVSNQMLAVQDRSNDNYEENRLTAQNSLDTSEFRIVSTVRTEFEMPKFPQAELTKHDSVTSMNEETACLCTPRIRKQEPEKNTVNLTTCKENRASKKTSPIPLTVNDVTVKTDYTLPKKESISYFKDSGSDKFVCEKLPSANLNRELDELKFVSPVPESTKHTFTTIGQDNNTIRNPEFTTEQTPVADLTKRNEPYSLPNKILTVIESCKIPENSAVKQINVELARGTSISSNVSSTTVNSFAPSPSTEATVTAMRMPTQTVSKFSAPTNDYAIQLFEETLLEPKWKQAQYICQVHSGVSFSSSTLQRETNIDIPANMIIPVNANETKTLQFRINESKPSIISDLNQLMEAYFSEYHRIRQYYTVEDALMLWKQRRSLEDIMKTSFFNIQNREWILHKAVEFINIKYTVMKTQDLDPDIIDLINLIALNFSLPHSRPIVKSISINESFQNNTENKKNFLHDIESKDIFIKSGIETLDPISSPSQLSNETALNKIIFTEINEQRFSTSNTLEISFGTYSSPVCVFSETELESVPIHEFVSLEKTKLQYMLQFPKSVIHPQSVRIEEIYESCESDLNQEFTSSTEQPPDNGENISSTDPSSILDFKSDHSYVKDYPYSHDFTSNESDNNVIDIKRKIEKSGSLNIALEYLPETKKSASDDNLKPFLKHRKKTPKPSAQIPIYSDEHQAADSERHQYQAQKMFETNEKDKIFDISTQTYTMSSERNNLDWLVQLFLLLNSFKTSSSYSWRMNENLNLSELPFLQTFMRLQDEHPNSYTADPKTILSLDSHGILRREQQYERFQMDKPSKISDYDYTFSEKIPQEEACTSEAISTINVLQLKRPKILCHLKASGIESIKLSVSRKDIQYLESESKALSSTIGLPKLEADATSKDEISNDAEGKEISKLPYSRARLSNATILSLIDDKIRSLEAYFSEHNNDSKSE
ncbi:uncharacterized protein LOC118186593 [Stegodyphus dumicola]|uniref:uncharacterized protein LOC118186593 n=1 Tax=Stegodyphus dumicola TaxID=202533 RepID=UPI0015AE6898|nr:uncharacterized protein LOC118186593 [Stegodyphus dumicola]